MRINANIMKSLFAKTIENIISLVKDVLKKLDAHRVPLFLLVGGFAECTLIQSAFKEEFGNVQIIVPDEVELSVLKGAVLLGLNPDYIASRVIRYTYGMDANAIFYPDIHDPNRKMSDYLMVASIHFGTAYFGYAFSTISNFKHDPLKIHVNHSWNAGGRQLLTSKTPTCLLLNGSKELVSFGYEAENDYAELALDNKHHDHYYFSGFKMSLFKNKGLTENMRLEDVTGKSILAIEVFALSIKALKDHLLKRIETEGTGVKLHEIKWVLTVPAIWPDNAKQFMRRSASKAGIDGRNLLIALEPEAASIYCQYLPTEKLKGASAGFNMAGVGQKYMVIDLGGCIFCTNYNYS